MNYLNTLYTRYEQNCIQPAKEHLNQYNPQGEEPSLNTGKNYIIFIEGLTLRVFLLVDRYIKTIASGFQLLISPSLAQKKICSNVRFLSAELFECIGVVICRALILLSGFIGLLSTDLEKNIAAKLIATQIYIEKGADLISGDYVKTSTIKERIDKATNRKKLLTDVYCCMNTTPEQEESWEDTRFEFDEILHSLKKAIGTRRIARDYTSILLDRYPEDQHLKTLEEFITPHLFQVIQKLQNKLYLLMQLNNKNPSEGVKEPNGINELSDHEAKLKYFKNLSTIIQIEIDQLHEHFDPEKKLSQEVDNLWLEIFQRRTLFNIPRFHEHFSDVIDNIYSIYKLYSFRAEVSFANDPDPQEAFVNLINSELKSCRKKFQERLLSWQGHHSVPSTQIFRPMALSIMGLTSPSTDSQIIKAYRKLAKIHHPDRGGDIEKFKTILNAYNTLISPPPIDD